MTKIIDIPDEPETPIEDRPVLDAGDAKDPLSMAELEARTKEWSAKQTKFKLPPHVVYTKDMHREQDSKYYSGRPRATGSETQRRAVQSTRRAVADHGAHTIRSAYGGTPKDDQTNPVVPTYRAGPEVKMGRCHHCNKEIPRVGVPSSTKFCPDKPACARAYRYKEKLRAEANKAFKDYHQSAQAKAEAVLAAEAYHVAAREMIDSAGRAGIEGAAFFATPAGVMGRADEVLPPVRIRAISNTDHPRYGAFPVERIVEVQASDVPEYNALLYSFDFPSRRPGEIGLVTGLEVRFLGDPGSTGWGDEYLTPEQQEANASEQAEFDARYAKDKRDREAWAARLERVSSARIGGGARSTSAREAHQEERMRNLLARPDHDVIVAEFEEAEDYDALREFYQARKRQNAIGRDNVTNNQSKQRVS
jgi:hypothetical protein